MAHMWTSWMRRGVREVPQKNDDSGCERSRSINRAEKKNKSETFVVDVDFFV